MFSINMLLEPIICILIFYFSMPFCIARSYHVAQVLAGQEEMDSGKGRGVAASISESSGAFSSYI